MKKMNLLFGTILSGVLSIFFVSCNNEYEPTKSNEDIQSDVSGKVTTRSGETFQVITLPVGYDLYRANQTEYINWEAIRNEPVLDGDWGNALYFFDEDIRNYLDSDHPYFIKVSFNNPFQVIDTDYEGFMDGNYDMDYVIAKIEAIVGSSKPAGQPFLVWLGEMGYGFRYYENMDREVAVAIPHTLLSDYLFSQELIDTL